MDVFVCENPVVVAAAADRLGPSCPPLICTSGQPSAAVMHLLRLIVSARGTQHYHGDFDWGGIRIANVLHDRVPFTPWRFDIASYLVAGDVGQPPTGTPVEARWDPVLTTTMHLAGRRIEEERVLDNLPGRSLGLMAAQRVTRRKYGWPRDHVSTGARGPVPLHHGRTR